MYSLTELNTRATDLTDLGTHEVSEIKELLTVAVKNGTLTSVQVQVQSDNDGDYISLYGVYSMTPAEVFDYYNQGGLWLYSNPLGLLTKLEELEEIGK